MNPSAAYVGGKYCAFVLRWAAHSLAMHMWKMCGGWWMAEPEEDCMLMFLTRLARSVLLCRLSYSHYTLQHRAGYTAHCSRLNLNPEYHSTVQTDITLAREISAREISAILNDQYSTAISTAGPRVQPAASRGVNSPWRTCSFKALEPGTD